MQTNTISIDESISEQIAVETLDDVVGNEDIFLLKTDTQGFEMSVLQGASNLLASGRVSLLLVEFSYGLMKNAGTNPVNLLNFIYDNGFVCTFMAYHTLKRAADGGPNRYGIVPEFPNFSQQSITFSDFVQSLKNISTPHTVGVSGWTDLMCWHLRPDRSFQGRRT